MRAWILLLLLAAPTAMPASVEASERVGVIGLAVAETDRGLVGTTATVEAMALQGGGRVYVDTRPLSQTDMQGSARLAARVAADELGMDWREHDVLITFRSRSTVIGGPSAGATMALAVAASLWSLHHADDPWQIDRGVATTGTINPDGTIGPVGGVPAKAQGAARAGLHTMLYPAGQEVAVDGDGRAVEMSSHCEGLGIRCIAVASLDDVVRVAGGRVLDRPAPSVPNTAQFPQLEQSVADQASLLSQRLDGTRQRAHGQDDAGVEAALDQAGAYLADAQAHLQAGEYYLAATLSFRGLIQQRYADALLDLHAAPQRETVESHVAECSAEVDALDVPDSVDDWTAWSAVAAAQVRVALAQELRQQAQARLAAATTVGGWQTALLESSFCIERVDTVRWWRSLPALLGAGPPVEDAEARSTEVIGRAADMVTYALGVQGAAGNAPHLLERARGHHEAGRFPAAMLDAVQAEAEASVALQARAEVSQAVLEQALLGAARAVARARAEGQEPVLAVSLIELSSVQAPVEALRDLWTARGVALLGSNASAPAPYVHALPSGPGDPSLLAALALVLVAGVAIGAGGASIVWSVRRPR